MTTATRAAGPAGVRRPSDRGLGTPLLLPLIVLILGSGTMVVANAWAVVDTRMAVDRATRHAAQWLAEEASAARSAEAMRAGAEAIARRSLGRRGTAPDTVVAIRGERFERCTVAVVEVRVRVAVVRPPFLPAFRDTLEVRGVHHRRVDPLRSGLGGVASCVG